MSVMIAEYTRRPKRTLAADGLLDIAFGLTLLSVALINYVAVRSMAAVREASLLMTNAVDHQANLLFLLSGIVANVLVIGSFAAIEPLKRRFVYPRLGYAALRVSPRRRLMGAAIALGSVALLAIAYRFHFPDLTQEVSLIISGSILSILLGIQFVCFGFVRHLVTAIISVIASILIALAHQEQTVGFAWFALIMGISMVVAGAITFGRVLRLPTLEQMETEAE